MWYVMWRTLVTHILHERGGVAAEVVVKNLAFIGQFRELPVDVVFTVEYSVRSARTAVYSSPGLRRDPPTVYTGKFDPPFLFKVCGFA
jgi:oleate hydratase